MLASSLCRHDREHRQGSRRRRSRYGAEGLAADLPEQLCAVDDPVADEMDAIELLKAHSGDGERHTLIKEARADYGILKDHFVQLAFDCQEAFESACASLAL